MAQKIIVDTDPGVDDVLAILLSLSSPEVSVALFTPPERGVTDPHDHLEISDKPAYENILDILRKEEAGTVSIVALGPCEYL
jgi:inosine-uridine nucleoside N-ribohydrolase